LIFVQLLHEFFADYLLKCIQSGFLWHGEDPSYLMPSVAGCTGD